MKNRICLSLLLTAIFFCTTKADEITFNSVTLEPGEQAELVINANLTNANLTSYQFDIYLPEGISVAYDDDEEDYVYALSGRHKKDHTLSLQEHSDYGFWRFIVSSNSNKLIRSGEGELLTLTLQASPTASGTHTVQVKNIKMAEPDQTSHVLNNASFGLTINTIVVNATSVSLDKTTLSFTSINQTTQLTATVLPTNATNKSVTWTSSNTAVATVDASGLVTAKSKGTATITATTTDGTNLSAECNVTVLNDGGEPPSPLAAELLSAISSAEEEIAKAIVGSNYGNIKHETSIAEYQAAIDAAKLIDPNVLNEDIVDQAKNNIAAGRKVMVEDMVLPESGKWYYIVENSDPNHASEAGVMYVNVKGNSSDICWTRNYQMNDATNKWHFIRVEDAVKPNVFYIQNMATGLYIGNQSANTCSVATQISTEPIPFELGFDGNSNVIIVSQKENDQEFGLHADAVSMAIVGGNTDDATSKWTFRELYDEEDEGAIIPIVAGTINIQTLPYASKAMSDYNDGIRFYAVSKITKNIDNNGTEFTTIELYEKDSFKAGEPFIIASDEKRDFLITELPTPDKVVDKAGTANGLVGVLCNTAVPKGRAYFASPTNATPNGAAGPTVASLKGYFDLATYSGEVSADRRSLSFIIVSTDDMPDETKTYYAIHYYVDNSKTPYAIQLCELGKNITLLDDPVKRPYYFSGWSKVPATMPDYDISVTGYFSSTPVTPTDSLKLLIADATEIYNSVVYGYDINDGLISSDASNLSTNASSLNLITLVDGDLSVFTETWPKYTSEGIAYLQVDLTGKAVSDFHFTMAPRTGSFLNQTPKAWTIEASNNGTDWNHVSTEVTDADKVVARTLYTSPVIHLDKEYRYVRFTSLGPIYETYHTDHFALCEFQLYNDNPTAIPIDDAVIAEKFATLKQAIDDAQAKVTNKTATSEDIYNLRNLIDQINDTEIPVSKVLLSKDSLSFSELKTTQTLVATVIPSRAANKTLIWTSSDETVATVDENGVVTSVNYGTATITATTTDGSNKSATCEVAVSILATGISLDKTSLTLTLNTTQTLTATFTPHNATYKTLVWTSSNTNVAIVNSDGVVTAKGKGTAIITATTTDGSNLSATCSVTVATNVDLTDIAHWEVTYNASYGYTFKDIATGYYINTRGDSSNHQAITYNVGQSDKGSCWELLDSNGNNVVSFNTQEKYYLHNLGGWQGGYAYENKTDQRIFVLAPDLSTAEPIQFISDGSGAYYICMNGKYIAQPSKNIEDLILKEITLPIATNISIDYSELTLEKGKTQYLKATVTPTEALQSVTWKSSNESVATVSENGLVTAKSNGTAMITATTADGSNLSATCTVTVTIPVDGISLSNTSLIFSAIDSKETLTATVTPSNASNKTLTWTSSNTNVATVSSDGVVTAKGNGTATITARAKDGSNISATCTVTVTIPVDGISLSNTSLTFSALNTTQTLTATVSPSSAANKKLTWTSSNTSVATVSSNGVVTSKGNGTATITAKATDGSNISATCSVTVAAPILVTGVSLNKTSLTFSALNTTQTLTATVTPSDASNKILTWTSSNTDVATVNIYGVVTSKGYGTATITATATDGSNKSATCSVTVVIPKYTLKFVADGKVVSEKSVEYGSAITAPNAPAKTGYTFVSWGDVATTMPAKDLTYTAQYKVNQYKLTYLIDGRVYKTYTLDYNSVINPEGDAEDDDYFYGWEDIPDRMPDHDVQVNAYITKVLGWAKSIDNKTAIYTLDGQKVVNPIKGNIYIINGKKVRY